MQRVIAYIDGFNLYFGLRENRWRKYYWLDLVKLVQSLLKPDQQFVAAHYFTARIRDAGNNSSDSKRQSIYLDALATLPAITIHEGHYLQKKVQCRKCGVTWSTFEEKMTDVNIAAQLLVDAFDNRYDTALIISGDSDLTTPVQRVRERFPDKRVVIALPPKRHSQQLTLAANGAFTIGEAKLRQSQLPDKVVTTGGYILQRPEHWR
ncbi:MAG: NYN domain-containing protein [Proteobacteria bacterium]|nr:NYN domain-containing protein [Pseudomonadota bacterium]MBU1688696.1 NYN domain-containing protein [Pseudomonadota bacterium]